MMRRFDWFQFDSDEGEFGRDRFGLAPAPVSDRVIIVIPDKNFVSGNVNHFDQFQLNQSHD
jgi:hypothetical protein